MWARFTVLSDTPIASAIVGCVIPLSRSNTIWMRWRCSGCPFQPNAVFKRRICFLVHLTICLSESDQMVRENHTPTLECNSLRHSVPQYRSTSIQSALETVLERFPKRLNRGFPCGREYDSSFLLGGGQHGWRSRIRRTCVDAWSKRLMAGLPNPAPPSRVG